MQTCFKNEMFAKHSAHNGGKHEAFLHCERPILAKRNNGKERQKTIHEAMWQQKKCVYAWRVERIEQHTKIIIFVCPGILFHCFN